MSPSVEPFDKAKYKALMDGLECSEISYNTIFSENRLDSEFFQKADLLKESQIDALSPVKIGDFAFVTDGIHTSIDFDEDSKINLISAKAPKKNFFDLSGTGYISHSQNNQNPRTQLMDNDVIVSTVGTIGNCAVVNESVLPANADRHVGIIRINEKSLIKPRYLSTFILSKYGQYQTRRFTTGNVQPNLFIYKVKDIKVPTISVNWQNTIETLVLQAEEMLSESNAIFNSAEMLLQSHFSIDNLLNQSCSVKNIKESFSISGRLDAEYYQPKFDILFETLKRFPCKLLGGDNGIVTIKKSIEPGSESYQDEGIPFVRVSDISKFEISDPKIHLSTNIVKDASKLYPKKNTILFSKDGSVGIAYKLEDDLALITSGALLHLIVNNTNEILPDYLTLILNSNIVQLQAERDSNGAIIQHWKPSDIEKVIVPVLDMQKQQEIASKVRTSFSLRKKSKEYLDLAKEAVEIAIEQSEKAAVKWLKEKVSDLEV